MTSNGEQRTSNDRSNSLAAGKLSLASIVFFVIAAAAPLAVFVGAGPLALRLGGIGAPGAFVVAGVVLFLFACGFTAMSNHVRDAGAFYVYVDRGLGPKWGGGTAMMTMASYGLCCIGFLGYIGFYAAGTADSVLGIDLPWQFWTLAFAVLVAILGYIQVDIGAKILGVLISLELGVILVLVAAVLLKGGPEPASAAPFAVDNVLLSTGSGTLLLLCFGAFIGFEGTAIYAEEAKQPKKTIPRATYIAIGFLTVFHASTFWAFTYGFGIGGAKTAVQQDDFLNMAFVLSDQYVGGPLTTALQLLIVTSYLACIVAFHNACARYLFSMGRSGLLPRPLSRTHPRTSSPHYASASLSAVTITALVTAVILKLDPFLELGTWFYAAGIIGIVTAQILCCLAVIVFFGRDRRGHAATRVLVAPSLGAIGLVIALWLIVDNFSVISGYTDTAPNAAMISVTPVCFLIGLALLSARSHLGRAGVMAEPELLGEQPGASSVDTIEP